MKFLFFLAVVFASIGTVSADLYLPSLPAIAINLHTTISMTQLSIAIFILGFSIARLLLSIISDAIGRRIPLITSLLLCLGGCFLCLFATNIYMFLAGRCLQGFGAGGSNVLGRVILRDSVEDAKLAKYLSYFSMFGINVMAIAPLFGGYLQHYFGWQASFIVLVAYTVFALILSIFFLPETNKYREENPLKLSILKTNFRLLLTNKSFVIYTLLVTFAYISILAWLTSGPVVLQKIMLLTPVGFGWCAILVGAGYFIGAYLNSRLVGKFGMQKMLRFGVWCGLFAGIIMLISVFIFHYITATAFVAPVTFAAFGLGMVIPNAFAGGLTPFAKLAGIAVGLLCSIQNLGGAAVSAIISVVPEHSQLPVGIVIFSSALISLILIKLLKKIA